MRTDIQKYAQLEQDIISLSYLNHLRNGYFVDIGCSDPVLLSNTYRLETDYEWTGLGIDIDISSSWNSIRPRTTAIQANALELNYQELFDKHNVPIEVNLLSIDLEPPTLNFEVLERALSTNRTFNVVVFETDEYRDRHGKFRAIESLLFMEALGYSLRATLYPRLSEYLLNCSGGQDQVFVHKSIIEKYTRC
jgi:hypothetical protein